MYKIAEFSPTDGDYNGEALLHVLGQNLASMDWFVLLSVCLSMTLEEYGGSTTSQDVLILCASIFFIVHASQPYCAMGNTSEWRSLVFVSIESDFNFNEDWIMRHLNLSEFLFYNVLMFIDR